MPKAKDQEEKVYAWERALLADGVLLRNSIVDIQELETFIDDVRIEFGTISNRIEVVEKNLPGKTLGLAYGVYKIELDHAGCNFITAAHEMAHLLLNSASSSYERRSLKALTDHGPVFVGILCYILTSWLEVLPSPLYEKAEEMGVKFFYAASCNPKSIKELKRLKNNEWLRAIALAEER